MTEREIQSALSRIRCFVLDMDGTIYLGNQLFSFTPAFLKAVRDSGREYCFFTNNSSKNSACYCRKLEDMGISVAPEKMLISNQVAIQQILREHSGKRVYVMGTEYLVEDFRQAGIPLDDQSPDVVVIGFDTSLTYEKVEKACRFVREGAVYYGVNMDYNCPVEGGGFLPDCGSIARMIEASTGRLPEFLGKPSRKTLDYIQKQTGYKLDELAVIGDRLYTDIALTKDSPSQSILVLTGESTLTDAEEGDIKPDLIFGSLEEIIPFL